MHPPTLAVIVALVFLIHFTDVHSVDPTKPDPLFFYFKDVDSVNPPDNSRPIRIHFDTTYLGLQNDPQRTCAQPDDVIPVGQSTGGICPEEGEWKNCDTTCLSQDVVPSELLEEIRNTYARDAEKYLQRGVRVVNPTNNGWKLSSHVNSAICGDESNYWVPVPEHYFNSTKSTEGIDLVIFLTVRPMQKDLISTSFHCARENSDGTGRPLMGIINLSPRMSTLRSGVRYLLIAHELLHVMGFSESIYGGSIIDRERVVNGESRTVGTLEFSRLVSVAREYFACPTMTYMQLENYGDEVSSLQQKPWLHSKNNHWEERILRSELMTGTFPARDLVEPAMSVLTLALLESLGWYWVDYHEFMNDYSFGRGYGCEFIEADCSALRWEDSFRSGYFCDGSEDGFACSFDHIAKATCEERFQKTGGMPAYYRHFDDPAIHGRNAHADYCTNYRPISTADCRFATNAPSDAEKFGEQYAMTSRCFVSDAIRLTESSSLSSSTPELAARCYEYACENGTALYVKVGDQWVFCPPAGGKASTPIRGFNGAVYCPPVDVLCPFNLTTDNFSDAIKKGDHDSIWDHIVAFFAGIHFGVWIAIASVIGIGVIVLGIFIFLLVLRHRRSRRWKTKTVVDVEKQNEELDHVDIEH